MKKKRDYWISALFLLPALSIFCVFVIYPVVSNIILSFQEWNGIYTVDPEFIGWDNYKVILSGKAFWRSLMNNGIFALVGFGIQLPLSFGLALLVTSRIKGKTLFRTVYYLPVILGTSIVALMWKNLVNINYGAVPQLLQMIGLDAIVFDWLNTEWVNVWVVALVSCWKSSAYNMLIFCAGLVTIPEVLREAAAIDGCTGWQQVRYITLPLMKNSFKVYSILCITGCIKQFDMIWAMTGGGPNASSSTPAVLLYLNAFTYKMMGRSAAVAMLLLLLGVSLSIVCNKIFKQED